LKPSLPLLHSAVAALLVAVISAVATVAQAPQSPQCAADAPPPRALPAPTNLKVLSKDLTGAQVQEIMEQWESALGVQCNSCHAEDRENTDPDDRPRLNYADDSKSMKSVARTMVKMTEEINSAYVAKIDSSGLPVTCGTCHRGHLGPEPFVGPSERRSATPQSPPPAEETPSPQ